MCSSRSHGRISVGGAGVHLRGLLLDGQWKEVEHPLAVSLTGGNRNGATQLLPLLDKVPAVAGAVGRPRITHRHVQRLAP